MHKLLLELFLIINIFCLPFLVNGQATGINFEKGLSWKEIREKAIKENKPIFLDCYASWCGPCKLMDQKIYVDKMVGDYFNLHFINVKVQIDRTPKDAAEIQSWYSDADSIAKKFEVNSFPTFIFFSAAGQPIHEIIGASETGTEFIAQGEKALDSESQYFTLIDNWASHKEDSVYLLHTLLAVKMVKDEGQGHAIANYYLRSLKDPIKKDNIELVAQFVSSETDESFQFFLNNADKIDELEGNTAYVENKLSAVIFKEQVAPLLTNRGAPIEINELSGKLEKQYPTIAKSLFSKALDGLFQQEISMEIGELENGKDLNLKGWGVISQKLQERFPGYDCGSILLGTEARYLYSKKKWRECAEVAISFIDRYDKTLSENIVNTYIWRCIFLHAQDKKILRSAVAHMKGIVETSPEDIDFLDTYANLLYKVGHQREAIRWENKAIEIATEKKGGDHELENTVKKMKNGAITWGDAAKS